MNTTPKQLLAAGWVPGIDVSDYQKPVDWNAVKAAGYRWVYVKATEGVTLKAKRFKQHVEGASAAGLYVGAYHYARPDNNSPEAEAKEFVETMYGVGESHLSMPPVLDNEHCPERNTVAWSAAFAAFLKEATGLDTLLYTYASMRRTAHPPGLALWLAAYSNDVDLQANANPVAWQYSCTAKVPGVTGRCDANVMSSKFFSQAIFGTVVIP